MQAMHLYEAGQKDFKLPFKAGKNALPEGV